MPSRLPVLLIHGYSDQGESFQTWADLLGRAGYDPRTIHVGDYQTLTNEVTIKDIAEGLSRALSDEAGLKGDEPFDAIMHSTGMLVIRAWLVAYTNRKTRLKHLVGLAPATFGSPLAHKGRSWLGTIFKGNRALGPDFMEAGDRVLDGLELASSFTWGLAHRDLVGSETFYGPTKRTPYPFIFCGTKDYSGIRGLIKEPGTDGTVRWAGCPLNTRKIILDFSKNPANNKRIDIAPWSNMDELPLTLIPDLNHETILTKPSPPLVNLVIAALQVDSESDYAAWRHQAAQVHSRAASKIDQWQQFIFRALDERDDPITDYNVQLFSRDQRDKTRIHREFAHDVHAYSGEKSLRCFHVKISDKELRELSNLWLLLTASSGSTWVGYRSFLPKDVRENVVDQEEGFLQVEMDLSPLLRKNSEVKLFYPFTTTLVEVHLDREPLPLTGKNRLFGLRSVES